MNIITELQEQIKEWRRQQDMLEDMIEEAHKRIDSLKSKGLNTYDYQAIC